MTLKDYYNSLKTTSPQLLFKDQVILRCRISNKTFYNWLNHPDRIPEWATKTIDEIKNELNITAS